MDNIVLSGQPIVIIKCGSNFSIGNIQYKKGQIVSIINDCDVDFTYSVLTKIQQSGVERYGAVNLAGLNSIIINKAPFNKMLTNLIFGNTTASIIKPVGFDARADEEGNIAIPHSLYENLQITDKQYLPIDYELDEDLNIIKVEPYQEIKIYYEIKKDGYVSKTIPSSLPYFQIEIIAKGSFLNLEERTSITQIIKLNKVSLLMEPFFKYNDGINNFDLRFAIIKNNDDSINYITEN